MGLWVIWVIAAAVLGVAELLTTTLAFGLVAVGALAAALASALGGNAAIQLTAFVAVSLAGIVLIRPYALRRLRGRPWAGSPRIGLADLRVRWCHYYCHPRRPGLRCRR